MNALKAERDATEQALQKALEASISRGTLLQVSMEKDNDTESAYLLNTPGNRELIEKIESGEITLPGVKTTGRKYPTGEELPDIFTLYEENIGILTPMVAEELREAEKLYPREWISDAVKEAVLYNKRNIKYILKILENWASEGRSDGTHQRDPKKTDPDKYIKGQYGHMVRR